MKTLRANAGLIGIAVTLALAIGARLLAHAAYHADMEAHLRFADKQIEELKRR